MPEHGEERNRMLVIGEAQPCGDGVMSHDYTYAERYCETCERWVECKTIVQHLLCKYCSEVWRTLRDTARALREGEI